MAGTIIDQKELQKLLHDFYSLTGIRITYWQPDGKMIVSCDITEDSRFCACIKSNEELCEKCRKCDHSAIELVRTTGKPATFLCHAGMKEYVYPIKYDTHLLGILMIGQTRHSEENRADIMKTLSVYETYGFKTEDLVEMYFELPLVSQEKMQAATRILAALACYIYLNGVVRLSMPPLIVRIEEYIDKNLEERILIEDVCNALFVCKTKLCAEVKRETGMTMVQWINKKRIRKVQEYLESGLTFHEAAMRSGFNDVAYCSRVFKNELNMSSTEFRNTFQNQKLPDEIFVTEGSDSEK